MVESNHWVDDHCILRPRTQFLFVYLLLVIPNILSFIYLPTFKPSLIKSQMLLKLLYVSNTRLVIYKQEVLLYQQNLYHRRFKFAVWAYILN